MTATNCVGYEIQVLDEVLGWGIETQEGVAKRVFDTKPEAESVLANMVNDGVHRRVYETLHDFPTQEFPNGYKANSVRDRS